MVRGDGRMVIQWEDAVFENAGGEKILFTVGSYSGNMADGHTMGFGPSPVGWGRRADGRTMGT